MSRDGMFTTGWFQAVAVIMLILVGAGLIWFGYTKAGGLLEGIAGFLFLGSRGKKRKAEKRAKEKADDILASGHPSPGVDATERMERRRKARRNN